MSKPVSATICAVCLLAAGAAFAGLTVLWTVSVDEFAFYRVTAVGPGDEIYWTGAVGEAGATPPPDVLRRYRADGSLDWEKKLPGESVWAMTSTPDGTGVLIAGADDDSFPGRPWVALHDSVNGKRRWRTDLDVVETALLTAIGVGADGAIYVAGRVEDGGVMDVFVARLVDADNRRVAAVDWWETLDLDVSDEVTALSVDPRSGNVAVAGYSFDPATHTGADDGFVAIFAPDGELVWSRRYDYGGMSGALLDIVYAPNGKWLYGAGRMQDDASGRNELFFQRFRPKNGKAKKPVRYDLSPTGEQWANALAVAADGRTVFLTGTAAVDSGPRHSVLLRTSNRGKRQEVVTSAIDGAGSTGVDIAIRSDGRILTAGQNGEASFLRLHDQ